MRGALDLRVDGEAHVGGVRGGRARTWVSPWDIGSIGGGGAASIESSLTFLFPSTASWTVSSRQAKLLDADVLPCLCLRWRAVVLGNHGTGQSTRRGRPDRI